MIIYNFIPLNSFDLLFDLFFKFDSYYKDIVTILPVLILCGCIFTVSLTFILYSSRLGEQVIKNAGKIGAGIVGGVTALDSTLNILDRFKDSGKSGGSGGSGGSDNNSDKKDNKDNKNNDSNDNKNDNKS